MWPIWLQKVQGIWFASLYVIHLWKPDMLETLSATRHAGKWNVESLRKLKKLITSIVWCKTYTIHSTTPLISTSEGGGSFQVALATNWFCPGSKGEILRSWILGNKLLVDYRGCLKFPCLPRVTLRTGWTWTELFRGDVESKTLH